MKKFKIVKSKKGDFLIKQKKFICWHTIGRFNNYNDCDEFIEKIANDNFEIKYNVREW